jgi:Arc/MetJ-type ribon-helix-helix transcriptional regulator
MLPVRAVAEVATFRPARFCGTTARMPKQTVQPQKRRGPAPTGKGHPVQVRLQPDLLFSLDAWIAKQREHQSRPEAIREILERALKRSQPQQSGPHKGARKAREIAGTELDRLGDATATEEERQSRKRRILKGPSEFREMRKDLPKPKQRARSIPVSKLNASNDV